MLANANSPTDSIPLDRNVREVVSICATHGLTYGEPNDLVGFMRALHDNKHLAMNFWSLVARLTDKAGARAKEPEWMLSTIVEGVTNRTPDEVRAVGPAHRVLVNRLAGMLAGEDVLTPIPDSVPSKPVEPVHAPDEVSAVRQAKLTDTIVPARAARLAEVAELTPRQSRTSAALASFRSGELQSVAPIPHPAGPRDERARLVLQPEQSIDSYAPQVARLTPATHDETPIQIPLSSYAESTRGPAMSGGLVIGGSLLLLLIAFGAWVTLNRDSAFVQDLESSLRSGYQSTLAKLEGTRATSATNGQSPAASVANGESSAPLDSSVPARTSVQSSTPPPRTGISRPAPEQPRYETSSAAPAPVTRRAPKAESFDPNADLSPGGGGRVVVPQAVMQDYLISSRVPIYPEGASRTNADGRVVMQAIINRDGTMGHLHVISGDPALRRAALEAVSTWRYRPYLLNGEPVDVSTTISVDFSGLN